MHSVVLLLCMAVSLFCARGACAETLVVASDSWCPYNCDEQYELEGYAVDILREIFEPAGITVDYRVMGWERAVEEARRGNVGAVIGAARREAEGFVIPDEEIALDLFAFYVRAADPWRYRGPESLLGKTLGLAAGYGMLPEAKAFIEAHKDDITIHYSGRETPARHNLQLLTEGRLDVIADDAQVIRHNAHVMQIEALIAYAGYDGSRENLYIAFSPANPRSIRYAALFDEGIRELRATKRLDAILKKYGLTDWKNSGPANSP